MNPTKNSLGSSPETSPTRNLCPKSANIHAKSPAQWAKRTGMPLIRQKLSTLFIVSQSDRVNTTQFISANVSSRRDSRAQFQSCIPITFTLGFNSRSFRTHASTLEIKRKQLNTVRIKNCTVMLIFIYTASWQFCIYLQIGKKFVCLFVCLLVCAPHLLAQF